MFNNFLNHIKYSPSSSFFLTRSNYYNFQNFKKVLQNTVLMIAGTCGLCFNYFIEIVLLKMKTETSIYENRWISFNVKKSRLKAWRNETRVLKPSFLINKS